MSLARIAVLLLALCGCKRDKPGATDSAPPPAGDAKSNITVIPVALARPALPAGWVEFKHPDGAFTVYTPGFPRLKDRSRPGTLRDPQPGVPPWTIHALDGKELYVEMEVNVFPLEQVAQIRADLKRNADSAKRGKPEDKYVEHNVTWAGLSAEEVEHHYDVHDPTSKTGTARRLRVGRSLWIGGTAYSFSIWGNQVARPTTAERAAFFDSFRPGK